MIFSWFYYCETFVRLSQLQHNFWSVAEDNKRKKTRFQFFCDGTIATSHIFWIRKCLNSIFFSLSTILPVLVLTYSFFYIILLLQPNVYSSGIEGNPTVFYRLMPGSTAQTNKFHTFYLQQRPDNGDTWADIKVNHPLDYESIKEYNLTIRVEVSLLKMNYTFFLLLWRV